jgi:lipopolysaccharide transport system ATP-binding protein
MSVVIKVENVSKQYRLGLIGTRTLKGDLQRWWYNLRGLPDPTLIIGQENILSVAHRKPHTARRTPHAAHRKPHAAHPEEYLWALKDINFEVKQGEVLGIIGKNGAGKSTLLKLLSRVTAPTTGNIKIKGRIASLLEVGTGFHPELTGRENIFLNGAILGMTKTEIHSKFDEIVDFAGVSKYIDTPVKRYSSGMYVRLAFAVAAHLEPEILIVDEVLAVGDAEFQKKAIGKMQDVSHTEGKTVLFVSHNMSSISTLCRQGIYLKNGLIRYSGPIQNTITKYLSEEAAVKTKICWNENERPGDEVASLISARLVDENYKDIVSVDIHNKIGVEYIYEVKIEGISRIPNIHVFTSKGDIVFVSGETDQPKFKNKGVFITILWIPENLLNVETYIIGIALSTMSPVKVHFFVQNAIIFDVVEDLNNRNNDMNQAIPGIIRPLLNWETTFVNN